MKAIDTHLHADHITGLEALAERLAPFSTLRLSTRELAERFYIPALLERRRRQDRQDADRADAKPQMLESERNERRAFAELAQQKQIELAVSLFLDLEQDRTVQQIADEMGMTVSSLKRLTQTAKFQETYDSVLMQLGHHPRLQALQGQLPELIPLSYQAMRRLLSPGTAHTAQVAATISAFVSKIDPRTGATTEENPKFLKTGDAAIVRIKPVRPLAIETFKDFPEIGRFALRDMGTTIGAGVVLAVTEKYDPAKK